MRGSARIDIGYRLNGQFVFKIAQLSHIISARGSQDLRSPSPIMAPDFGGFQMPWGPFLSGKAEKSGQFPWVALSQATEKIIRKPFV